MLKRCTCAVKPSMTVLNTLLAWVRCICSCVAVIDFLNDFVRLPALSGQQQRPRTPHYHIDGCSHCVDKWQRFPLPQKGTVKWELCQRHYSSVLVSVAHIAGSHSVVCLEIKGFSEGEEILKVLCHFVFGSSHDNKANRGCSSYYVAPVLWDSEARRIKELFNWWDKKNRNFSVSNKNPWVSWTLHVAYEWKLVRSKHEVSTVKVQFE